MTSNAAISGKSLRRAFIFYLLVLAFKRTCRQNHNKKVRFLNTELLVLKITCNDFRKRLRSKVVRSAVKFSWFF